jgi:hypothetical protein
MTPRMRLNLPRLDANETIFLQRELEGVDPVNYMTLFAGLLGRRYIPPVSNVSPLDEVYTYKMFTQVGQAKIGSSGGKSKNLPTVAIKMTPTSSGIKQIPVSYTWGVREIQQAAKNNIPLDQLTIQAAMSSVARQQDTMLAFGESGLNIKGLLNNDDVDFTTPSTKTGAGAGTKWVRAVPVSPNEILRDINLLVAETRAALKQASLMPGGNALPAFDKFTILLDTTNYGYIASTPRSDNSDTTILQYALKNNPFIESIEEWWQCDLADEGTGPIAVCYPRDEMCLGAVLPVDFESLNPQEEGHDIVVPAHGSCGGTVIRYTMAVRYMKDH